VACVLLVAGAGYAYLKLRLGEINSVHIPGITPATSGPTNILIVGSDSRANLNDPNAAQQFGQGSIVAGQRSDVTMVLHIDPGTKQASVLSIPRDLLVPIAGTNRTDRINSSFGQGPQQLIQTIQADMGIPINHYVSMNFDGFQGLVNAVGGIDMNFPDPAKDAYSGLNITKTGCQHLNGAAALSLARSRDYEYFALGEWHYDGSGDLGRIQRQHTFIRVLMAKAISAGIHNPITANAIVSNAVHDVTVDDQLSTSGILGLISDFRSLNPDQLPTYTLPTSPETLPSLGDVLVLQQPGGQQTINEFLGKTQPPPSTAAPTPPPIAPSTVRVQVLNGSGTASQAAHAADQLRSAGFVVAGTGNAAGTHTTVSEVLYANGKQAQAQLLQGRIGGGTTIKSDPALQGADVTLVTGTSFTGITAATPAPAPAPAPPPATTIPPYDPRAC
jgi:LCP family protein required for cell wall assembly